MDELTHRDTRDASHLAIRNTRLFVSSTGGGSATIMLVHGLADSGACWAPLLRRLQRSYRVLVPDLRGHGKSAAPAEGLAPEELGLDLLALLDAFQVERAILIGHSLGADAAMRAAVRQPDRVRALVLEDPPWVPEWDRHEEDQRAALAQMWFHKLRGLAELSPEDLDCVAKDHAPQWSEEDLQLWVQSKREVRLNVVRTFLPRRSPWQTAVASLNCPTLLLTGDTSRGAIVTPQLAREAQALNPLVSVENVPHAGHSIRRDDFNRYVAHVERFLAAQDANLAAPQHR